MNCKNGTGPWKSKGRESSSRIGRWNLSPSELRNFLASFFIFWILSLIRNSFLLPQIEEVNDTPRFSFCNLSVHVKHLNSQHTSPYLMLLTEIIERLNWLMLQKLMDYFGHFHKLETSMIQVTKFQDQIGYLLL